MSRAASKAMKEILEKMKETSKAIKNLEKGKTLEEPVMIDQVRTLQSGCYFDVRQIAKKYVKDTKEG